MRTNKLLTYKQAIRKVFSAFSQDGFDGDVAVVEFLREMGSRSQYAKSDVLEFIEE